MRRRFPELDRLPARHTAARMAVSGSGENRRDSHGIPSFLACRRYPNDGLLA